MESKKLNNNKNERIRFINVKNRLMVVKGDGMGRGEMDEGIKKYNSSVIKKK